MSTIVAVQLAKSLDVYSATTLDRALMILWCFQHTQESSEVTTALLGDIIQNALGHPKQNLTRLRASLKGDRRAAKASSDSWKLHPKGLKELNDLYSSRVVSPKAATPTDSVLPRSLFLKTRPYIEKVVYQINASYDSGLFDCCAVMCRRLLETLIIEVYESKGRSSEIKGPDGHFLLFSGLLSVITHDGKLGLSRNAAKGLVDFKHLGDLSAHNRRFLARQDDIDRARGGIRVSAEELLHLAQLV